MNKIAEQIQQEYRAKRESSNYSIFDIEKVLEYFAERGIIWVLKDMKDICESEEFLIEKYLNKFRSNQIYDNLDEWFKLEPSNNQSDTIIPFQSSKKVPVQKQSKKHQNLLKVKDVKNFIGYEKAKELEDRIFEVLQNYPTYELNIIDQLGRSSKSITKSIMLGEQFYIREKFKNYNDAIGSAKETSTWLQISLGQQYITKEKFDELDNLVKQVISILTRTLFNIKEKEGKGMDLPSPFTPDVKNFKAYQYALLVVEKTYKMTRRREFWNEKDLLYGTRRYSTSCAANISEANQLYTPRKFKFFNNALEALNGLDCLLEKALSKGMISKDTFEDIVKLIVSIRNILSKKMGNMRKQKAS